MSFRQHPPEKCLDGGGLFRVLDLTGDEQPCEGRDGIRFLTRCIGDGTPEVRRHLLGSACRRFRYGSQIGLDETAGGILDVAISKLRSEERRVGKECRSRWSPSH